MTPTEMIGAVVFLLGMFGIVAWMVTRLQRAYRVERERQAPEQRSSPLLVIVLALAIYGTAAWITDYRTAVSLTLAGVALAAVVQNRITTG